MAATPIVATPVAPAVNIPGQLSQALTDAPVEMAANQQKIAASKAAVDDATAKQDDLHLSRIAPALEANPALANSPAMKAILGPILQRRGFSPGADGAWDPATLQGILNPQKPFSSWTQEDVNKAMAVPPNERILPHDAPDWLKTEQVRTPMTPVGLNQVFTGLSAKEKLLTDPKNGYQPAMFLQDVRQTQARLKASGNFAEADSLNEYLNEDGTKLNDAFISRHVGEQAQAEIDKIHSLGIHLENEDEFKLEREQDLRDQFGKTMVFKREKLNSDEQIAAKKAENQASLISNARARLNAYMGPGGTLDLAKKRYDLSKSNSDFRVVQGLLHGSESQISNAEKSLNGVSAQINAMSQNAALRNSPMYQSLIAQAADLRQFIDTQGPMLRQQSYDADSQIYRTYSQITGNTINVPGSKPPEPGAGTEKWSWHGLTIVRDPNDPNGFIDYATGKSIDTTKPPAGKK